MQKRTARAGYPYGYCLLLVLLKQQLSFFYRARAPVVIFSKHDSPTVKTEPLFETLNSLKKTKATIMKQLKSYSDQSSCVGHVSGFFKISLIVVSLFISGLATAQTFPPASSCTSKDLELLSATLPPNSGESVCDCDGTRTLVLGIRNKTGSTRTAFALWGTLKRYDATGQLIDSVPIFACAGPIVKNSDNFLPATSGTTTISVNCGESLEIVDLYLAWTSASPGETCSVLQNNPSTINPKCGTLDKIQVGIGVDASFSNVVNPTCANGGANGSITVSPFGGKAPYKVKLGSDERTGIAAGGSTTFTGLSAATHTFLVTDANGCTTNKMRTLTAPTAVTANAGADFTKSCLDNPNGKQIGEASTTGFTYAWSPTDGLSATNVSNPTANPSSNKTYTVTKTNTSTGCSGTDDVTVAVNKPTVTANAGDDFTKTCLQNASGKEIGEASAAGFTYSWSPSTGLSAANVSNPTANPSTTTVYTVTKTHTSSDCSNTDNVTVTVSNEKPQFTVCIVQPSLCSTGSLTINASGGSNFQYSINGGTTYQSNGGSYTGLGASSVTSVKVKNGDGCESDPILCANLVSNCAADPVTRSAQTMVSEQLVVQDMTVKAYPNPFSDKVKFLVTSSMAGNGSLDLYNMMGQKVKTVYTGFIAEGTQTFEMSLPTQQVANLVYVLRVGDKKATGKILQINR